MSNLRNEAKQALVSLGFKVVEIAPFLASIQDVEPLEVILKSFFKTQTKVKEAKKPSYPVEKKEVKPAIDTKPKPLNVPVNEPIKPIKPEVKPEEISKLLSPKKPAKSEQWLRPDYTVTNASIGRIVDCLRANVSNDSFFSNGDNYDDDITEIIRELKLEKSHKIPRYPEAKGEEIIRLRIIEGIKSRGNGESISLKTLADFFGQTLPGLQWPDIVYQWPTIITPYGGHKTAENKSSNILHELESEIQRLTKALAEYEPIVTTISDDTPF